MAGNFAQLVLYAFVVEQTSTSHHLAFLGFHLNFYVTHWSRYRLFLRFCSPHQIIVCLFAGRRKKLLTDFLGDAASWAKGQLIWERIEMCRSVNK